MKIHPDMASCHNSAPDVNIASGGSAGHANLHGSGSNMILGHQHGLRYWLDSGIYAAFSGNIAPRHQFGHMWQPKSLASSWTLVVTRALDINTTTTEGRTIYPDMPSATAQDQISLWPLIGSRPPTSASFSPAPLHDCLSPEGMNLSLSLSLPYPSNHLLIIMVPN